MDGACAVVDPEFDRLFAVAATQPADRSVGGTDAACVSFADPFRSFPVRGLGNHGDRAPLRGAGSGRCARVDGRHACPADMVAGVAAYGATGGVGSGARGTRTWCA